MSSGYPKNLRSRAALALHYRDNFELYCGFHFSEVSINEKTFLSGRSPSLRRHDARAKHSADNESALADAADASRRPGELHAAGRH
jgi:hypothetical protein